MGSVEYSQSKLLTLLRLYHINKLVCIKAQELSSYVTCTHHDITSEKHMADIDKTDVRTIKLE